MRITSIVIIDVDPQPPNELSNIEDVPNLIVDAIEVSVNAFVVNYLEYDLLADLKDIKTLPFVFRVAIINQIVVY